MRSTFLSVVVLSLFLLAARPAKTAESLFITNAEVANITNTQALVIWDTSRVSTSQVVYSDSPCPCNAGLSDPPERLVTHHEMTLTNLTADRDYYLQVVSTDPEGSRAQSTTISFRTLKDATLPAVLVSDVRVSDLGATSATVTWKTNIGVWGGSGVEFGTSTCPCPNNVQVDLGGATSHRVEVAPLEPNTAYSLRPLSYHPKDTNTIVYGPIQAITTTAGAAQNSASAELLLRSPNGGEVWRQGERHLVSWKTVPGFVNALKISLLSAGNERTVLVPLQPTEQRANGNASITIPQTLSSGSYTLEIADANNLDRKDTSDATITIGELPKPAAPPPPPSALEPLTFLPPTAPAPAPEAVTSSPPPAAQVPTPQQTTESAKGGPASGGKPKPVVKTVKKPAVVKKAKPKAKVKPKSKAKLKKKPAPKKAPVKR